MQTRAAPILGECRSPTEISVELTTDEACQATRGTAIAVGTPGQDLGAGADAVETNCVEATTARGANSIGSMVLVPSGEKNDAVSIRVVVGVDVPLETCAVDAGGCIVASRRLRYVPHTPLHLPIALRAACKGPNLRRRRVQVGRPP